MPDEDLLMRVRDMMRQGLRNREPIAPERGGLRADPDPGDVEANREFARVLGAQAAMVKQANQAAKPVPRDDILEWGDRCLVMDARGHGFMRGEVVTFLRNENPDREEPVGSFRNGQGRRQYIKYSQVRKIS